MRALRRLSPAEADRLREEPFTYHEVGRTRTPYPSGFPTGYHLVRRREVVGHGRVHYERATEKLMTWRMHVDSGLRAKVSSPRVGPDEVLVARLGLGRLSLRLPCRVVYVVDEKDRHGFGYGTLPGHPESGEESFVVALEGDEVTLTVTAFARPGRLLTRLGGPLSRWMQSRALGRYTEALR